MLYATGFIGFFFLVVPPTFPPSKKFDDFVASPPVRHDAPAWKFFTALMELVKPVVAAVDGPAIGIGTTILLHCDLVFATPRSQFALPFASLGITPEGASSLLLPLLAGRQRATELLMLGKGSTPIERKCWVCLMESFRPKACSKWRDHTRPLLRSCPKK
nr:enoyl-CoA hydratase-related protein [Paraburkholderia caribensis]